MLSLPLTKLSTAQDAGPEPWKHDFQNLTVVIDTFGARGPPSQLLKVVQGTQVLHLIEIERLINDGNDLITTMQRRGIELKVEQLPISAIVRCPCLAFRWQSSDRKDHRIQLRFATNADYDTAYNHLHRLGLHMNAAKGIQPRPSTSSTATLVQGAPSSSLKTSQYSHSHGNDQSRTPSRLSGASARPYTAVTAPTSIEASVQEAAHARPVSSYTGYGSENHTMSNSLSGALRPPEYFARPSSATSSVLDQSPGAFRFETHDLPSMSTERVQQHGLERPSSASFSNRPETPDALLPPRRELPFARSASPISSGSDRPGSRLGTGLMGPPPLPARVASLRPPSSRSSNQVAELPALPKPTVIDITQQQPSWMKQPPRTPIMEQDPPPSAQPAPCGDKENRPPSSSGSSSPLSARRASSITASFTRPLGGLSGAAQNRRRTESQSPITSPLSSNTHDYRTAAGETPDTTAMEPSDSLAAYTTQSAEDRRAALNEFIFHCLEDDNFLTLVEDMETAYARIGINMRRPEQ